MRRVPLWTSLAVLVAILLWFTKSTSTDAPPASSSERPLPARAAVPASQTPEPASPASLTPRRETPDRTPDLRPSSPSSVERRAFRFVLNGQSLALEAAEDIRGDFHRRRGQMAWQPGMIYCRLLDAAHRVLAEETVPAPDHVCVVLDPHTPGADGQPQPAVLTPPGPVVFQVRLPKLISATQMKVYRLAGTRPAALNEEPLGELLATIPLAQ